MDYDFSRYVAYMKKNDVDLVIASSFEITARMLNDYFKDLRLINIGSREYNPLVCCDRRGETFLIITPQVAALNNEITIQPCFEPQVEMLIADLKKRGLEKASIGLDMLDFPAVGLVMLQESLPDARFVNATTVFRQDLARKTEREIRLVRQGILIAEAGFRNVLKNLRASLGKPVSRVIHEHFIPEVARLGGEVAGTNLTSIPWEWWDGGPKPSNIIYTVSTATKEDAGKVGAVHANTWEEGGREPKVREGGIPMNFDLCCYYHGMLSDGAFRAIVGESTPSFVEVWDLSVELFHALPKCIKAGMTCGEVEKACLETFRRVAGNKWDKNYWAIHGHGYHIHEFPQVGSPYFGQTDDYIFEAGNVLAVETIAEASFVLREDGMQPLGEMPMKIYSV